MKIIIMTICGLMTVLGTLIVPSLVIAEQMEWESYKKKYYKPIAQYPLISNTQDSTRSSPAIDLTGVQFHDGALYSGGVYNTDTASAFPNNWDRNDFIISARFRAHDLEKDRPVFITGHRSIGFYLNKNGTVSLLYNNDKWVHSDLRFKLNTWHRADVVYDNRDGRGSAWFLLDGKYAHLGAAEFQLDWVNQNPTPSVGITDYSNGATFKGWIKDLSVYRSATP